MRCAIISDIHSNLHALNVVLRDIDEQGVDEVLCAGDLVGYGAFPNEVIAQIKERKIISICGNHDRAVLNIDTSGMNPLAAKAVYWTAKQISFEALGYLKKLKPRATLNLAGIPAAMFHGSVRNDDEYVYEEDAVPELLNLARARVVISGHTHVPYVKRYSEGVLLNPGSVGQPRDGDRRASYLILDGDEMRFELRRLDYPVEEAAKAISAAGLPDFLGLRLLSGI
ncbi:MAG: metallophosphoesterase family protein [Methanomassiliicoccales archaeon]